MTTAAAETARAAIKAAVAEGVTPHALSVMVAEEGGWTNAPSVIAIEVRHSGRTTQMTGLKIGAVSATELKYVDGRWVVAANFYSPGIGTLWAQGLERFIRRLPYPVLIGRHPIRDYRLVAEGFKQMGVEVVPPISGCPSIRLARNGEFPVALSEVPAFLNVLAITPTTIRAHASPLEGKDARFLLPL